MSPKQDKPKEAHTKTHNNYNDKGKDKDRILKTPSYLQETHISLSSDFSAENIGQNLIQPRLLYLGGLSFKIEGEIPSQTIKS